MMMMMISVIHKSGILVIHKLVILAVHKSVISVKFIISDIHTFMISINKE